MKRIFHRELMRGPVAQRAAIALWVGLIAVLFASVLHGVRGLSS